MQDQKLLNCEPLKALVRTVPDFPKPGILFYDITTLLKDKTGFAQLIDAFAAYYIGREVDLVLGQIGAVNLDALGPHFLLDAVRSEQERRNTGAMTSRR